MNALTLRPGASAPRRPLSVRQLIGAVLAAVLMSTLLGALPASAASCLPSDLVPQVRGYSINQGLSSYQSLVRGKDIVFRLFLSRPQCAEGTSQYVALTRATLSVKAGAATLMTLEATNSLNPAPILPYYSAAPALQDSTGDPKWVVDGPTLAAAAPPAATPLTFEAVLSYANSAGTTGTTLPISTVDGKLISKTLLGPTTPLRILSIPMGDPTKTLSSQFSDSAKAAITDGFSVLDRIFPVADGTAGLKTATSSTSAGVRYHVNTNTQLDVRPYMTNGIFCDNGRALQNKIAPQMETNLKNYNTAQETLETTADFVLGAIDQAISSDSCTEGYALINSRFSYARARYGSTSPDHSGAIMGMELTHNFGAVPCGSTPPEECSNDRDNGTDQFHAQNTWAHSLDPADQPDVAYYLPAPTATGQPIADDRNVMKYAGQAPAGSWVDTNTFLQKEDWALLTCKLGGPTTPDCALPIDGSAVTGGAAAGAVATSTIVGTTDGTKENTEVFDSFADVLGPTDHPRNSFIHLIQKNEAGQVVQDQPVRLTDDGGDGHHGSSDEEHSHLKVFSASFSTHDDAVELELVNANTGVVLYERFKSGGGPRNVHTTVTMTGVEPSGCTDNCPPAAEMSSADGFGTEAQKIDFETNPLTGQAYSAGDPITTEYLLSKGVTFNKDSSTPKIIGDCLAGDNPCRFPPGTSTRSGRFALWNAPETLPVGPIDPVPDSSDVPLTINFVEPVQKVGLYIGNDDTSTTTAKLTAFDALGKEIKTVSKSAFGPAIMTFIGIDAGRANVASIRLDYGNSPLGEEIDDLIFERPPGSNPTNTYRIVATAEDDPAQEMRAAFFARCRTANEILVSGLKPDPVEGDRGTFTYDFDATQVCRDRVNPNQTTILVRFNDGYNQTGFYSVSVKGVSGTPPTAVIDTPAAEAQAHSILQHEPIYLEGQGWDAQEGVLPGDNLMWKVTGPTGVISNGETGNELMLRPPAGTRWTPGLYTAELTVKNSAGLTNTTTATFRVLEDKDNDGIPIDTEACYKGSDTDPNDAFGDYDKDGVVNQQDENPCSPRPLYEGQGDFDPNTLNYPSKGGSTSVTMKVTLRYRDLAQVSGKTVRITRLGGRDVPATDAYKATAWAVATSGGITTGTAKFDRQAIIDFLCPSATQCQTNQTVWITITGDAPAGGGSPAYSFNASDAFQVQKS